MIDDYLEEWTLPGTDGTALRGGLTERGESDSLAHAAAPVRQTACLLLKDSPGLKPGQLLRRTRDGALYLVAGEEEHAPACCTLRLSRVRVEKLVNGA